MTALRKIFCISAAIASLAVFFGYFGAPSAAFAFSNQTEIYSASGLSNITSGILVPFVQFLNSAGQISKNFISKGAGLNANSLQPQSVFGGLPAWFQSQTGYGITDILKVVGEALLWIFGAISGLIKWLLSFIS